MMTSGTNAPSIALSGGLGLGSKSRSTDGCWTCRLRRKKCDELHPVCRGCAALEIDCLYSEEKPDWMDGGERQKERAEWLKTEVKRRAGTRREKRYLQILEPGSDESAFVDVGAVQTNTTAPVRPAPAPSAPSAPANATDADGDGDHAMTDGGDARATSCFADSSSVQQDGAGRSSSVVSFTTPQDTGSEASWQQVDSASSASAMVGTAVTPSQYGGTSTRGAAAPPSRVSLGTSEHLSEEELSMMMTYLDHVFPFLFPYYRPPMINTGRGWLLVMLMRTKSLFHTALTLSSYFMSVIFNATSGSHEACRIHNWNRLLEQQDLSLQEMQRDMTEFNARISAGSRSAYPVLEAARLMGSIVQMLVFEVAIGNTGHWQLHLDAASELLDQMMTRLGNEPTLVVGVDGEASHQQLSGWASILMSLGRVPNMLSPVNTPWSVDQAALRFFAANLIQLDVLSATALEQPPRLHKWHAHLLSDSNPESIVCKPSAPGVPKELALPHLRLEGYVGLQNWVVAAIGDIAALAAWKKEMKRANSLSISQLVTRAAVIESELRAHIQSFDAEPDDMDAPPNAMGQYGLMAGLEELSSALPCSPRLSAMSAFTSRVWAQAALTYLSVVVSGWQPASIEIRASVDAAVALLSGLKTPSCLRTVTWPFFVTACLAGPEHEAKLRTMVASMGPLQAFGTVKEALAMVEQVWASRASIVENPDAWDLAACLRQLGHAALLI